MIRGNHVTCIPAAEVRFRGFERYFFSNDQDHKVFHGILPGILLLYPV